MSGSGTDKTKSGLDLAGTCCDPCRTTARREYRHGRASDGQLRSFPFKNCEFRATAGRTSPPNARRRCRPVLEERRIVRHRRAGGRGSDAAVCDHRPCPRPGQAGGGASDAAVEIAAHVAGRGGAGIMFGRERYGLQNEEVALANRIITFPVNPGFASLNLAQAVLLIGYEWFKLSTGGTLPFAMPERSEPALPTPDAGLLRQPRPGARQGRVPPPGREAGHHAGQPAQHLYPDGPDQAGHAHPPWGRDGDRRGPQGPAKAACSTANRRPGCGRCWPKHSQAAAPSENGTVRGLARLLRRNPTDAERMLWHVP